MRLRVLAYVGLVWGSLFLVPPAFDPASLVADAAPVQTNEVRIDGFAFVPADIIVLPQDEVVWINQDSAAESGVHSVTPDPGQTMSPAFEDNDPILTVEFDDTGANRAKQTFSSLGYFTYHCKYHPNMHGSVRVVSSLASPVVNISARDDGANENYFTPDYVQINKTQRLVWTNHGENTHNVVFDDPDIGEIGDLAEPGDNASLMFEDEGNYRYRCVYHSTNFDTGMVGKVTVGNMTGFFPPVVNVTNPTNHSTVSGTLTVEGLVTDGFGQPVSAANIDVRFGADADWKRATNMDGVWAIDWNTELHADGAVELGARATRGDLVSDIVTMTVLVANGGANPTNQSNGPGDGAPGEDTPGLPAMAAAFAAAAALLGFRRRRDP